MKTYNIEITASAEKDLHEIAAYISKELLESKIATKVITKVVEGINLLQTMPLRNALVSDNRLAYQGIRKIIVDNYIIFYKASEKNNVVTIIRILYNRRNWINLI